MKAHCSKIVAIGEAAVVGAGFGVALIGVLEIATAITAPQWLTEAKRYIDYAPLVSGAVGAIVGESRIARRRRWAAAKIAGVSDRPVARVRAELEGISQISKLDETLGADSKSKQPSCAGARTIMDENGGGAGRFVRALARRSC
jgi:hypothetical protein